MKRNPNWIKALSLLLLVQTSNASISPMKGVQQKDAEIQLWSSQFAEIVKKQIGEVQLLNEGSLKEVVMDFWDKDFPRYHMHSDVQKAIGRIDDQEMASFLISTGVEINTGNIIAPKNLTAYLRYKKIGTAATYAWIDIYKGHPTFIQAFLDWQTIKQEYGFEFAPTYYLLANAKLESKKDAEVWGDLFTATFTAIPENDTNSRTLMLFCLMPRIWEELKEVDPPAKDRFALLGNELEKQAETTTPYAQILAFNLFSVNFCSGQFSQAAEFTKVLIPKKPALHLRFITQVLGQDLAMAKTALFEIEIQKLANKEELETYRAMLVKLEQMTKTQPPETDASP